MAAPARHRRDVPRAAASHGLTARRTPDRHRAALLPAAPHPDRAAPHPDRAAPHPDRTASLPAAPRAAGSGHPVAPRPGAGGSLGDPFDGVTPLTAAVIRPET
ncbi:hypothetical protein GCM10009635_43510 [Actinocatenispora thailandica]